MSDRDIEKLLAEMKHAGLPAEADAAILEAIHTAQGGPHIPTPVYRKPVPAWAAAAACLAVGTASWMTGARTVQPLSITVQEIRPIETRLAAERPPLTRVHVESDAFVVSPRRDLDVSNWAPVSGAKSESRS